MTRTLHQVRQLDDTVEIPVIDGDVVLDETVEIPLIQLRPAVPPRMSAATPPSSPPRIRQYGWLIGLVLAGLIVYAPILLRGLGDAAPWVVLAGVAWTVLGVPLAFLIGLSIRVADEKAGHR